MFNLGVGEITVLALLALIFIGPKYLPDITSGLGSSIKQLRERQQGFERPPLLLRRRSSRRWTFSDWLLACAAVLAFAIAVALLYARLQ